MEGGEFRKFDVLWELPALSFQQPNFGDWCRAFVHANFKHRQTLHRDLRLPLEAYLALLRSLQPNQWTGPTSFDAYRLAARELFTSGEMALLIADELNIQASTSAMGTAEEQRKLEKYFPRVSKDAVFCIGCASYGHRFVTCPLRSCRLCGSSASDHTLFGCTAISTVSENSEPVKGKGKATVASASPSKCRYCLEDCIHGDVCPLLWRTFVHNPASKRSADEISTACYVCGLDDHFGGDCKDNTGEHISGRQYSLDDDIWSRKYALHFSELTTTRRFVGSTIADDGDGSAAAAQPKREAKRAKTGQSDENTGPQAPQADAEASGVSGNKGKRKNKAKGDNKQTPGPGKPPANISGSAKSRRKRNRAQQPASLDVTLPNRPATTNPAGAMAAPVPAPAITNDTKPAPQTTAPATVPLPVSDTTNVQPQSKKAKGKGKGKQAATPTTAAKAPEQSNSQQDIKNEGEVADGLSRNARRKARQRMAGQGEAGAESNAQARTEGRAKVQSSSQGRRRRPRNAKGNNGAAQAQAQPQVQA